MFKKHSQGFTLIEAMITLAIAAIVLSIGVPSFQNSIKNNRKKTAINDLRTALALARSTAITRRTRVTVCKSPNNTSCVTSGDWSQGWIIFADPNNQATVDPGEPILRVHDALKLSSSGSFSGDNFVKNHVSFTPQGMFDKGKGGFGGTLTYSDGGSHTGQLIISLGGNVHSDSSSSTSPTGS